MWLVFDMGEVLMNHDIPSCIKRFQEILEDDYHKLGLDGNGEGTGIMEKFEKGLVGAGRFIDFILGYSKPGTTAEDVVRAWNLMHAGIPEELISTLRRLKAAGYRYALFQTAIRFIGRISATIMPLTVYSRRQSFWRRWLLICQHLNADEFAEYGVRRVYCPYRTGESRNGVSLYHRGYSGTADCRTSGT